MPSASRLTLLALKRKKLLQGTLHQLHGHQTSMIPVTPSVACPKVFVGVSVDLDLAAKGVLVKLADAALDFHAS